MQRICNFCLILTKAGKYRHILLTTPNIKFHENPSGGSRAVLCGQTDTKLLLALRNCLKWSKKSEEQI
jgi:hypothetical protein